MRSPPRALGVLLALLMTILYAWTIYFPLQERLELAEKGWEEARQRETQASTLARLHGELEEYIVASARGLNLVSRLQTLLRKKRLQDRIVQLQSRPPKAPPGGGPAPNETALLRLDRLDLAQLQAFLAAMDTLDRNIWVRSLEVKRQGKDEATVQLEIDEIETE